MNSYIALLRTRGVARIMTAQLVARIPNGMLSLAYLLHIQRLTGSYGAASLATTGTTNANAAAFIGVANSQYPLIYAAGITGGQPPGDTNVAAVDFYTDGEFLFYTTSGDTYHVGDKVYLAAAGLTNGRTVAKAATGTFIGYVAADQRQPNSPFLTAAPAVAGGATIAIYVRIVTALLV